MGGSSFYPQGRQSSVSTGKKMNPRIYYTYAVIIPIDSFSFLLILTRNERKAEVRIQFEQPPGAKAMFPGQKIPPNELVMRLQPDEAVYMKVNVKEPGLKTSPVTSELDLTYKKRFAGASNVDAYSRLLLDVLRGSQAAFVRDDELRAAWKIFTPVLHRIEREKIQPIKYGYGTRGPQEADRLLAKMGFRYHAEYKWSNADLKSGL